MNVQIIYLSIGNNFFHFLTIDKVHYNVTVEELTIKLPGKRKNIFTMLIAIPFRLSNSNNLMEF